MFNSVNNPFGKRIESALSTGQEKQYGRADIVIWYRIRGTEGRIWD